MHHWRRLPIAIIGTIVLTSISPHSAAQDSTANEPDEEGEISLTLEQALTKTLEQNPYLATFPWELRAADGRIRQAGLRPNPELSVELENIALSDSSTSRTSAGELDIPLSLSGARPGFAWNRESDSGDQGVLSEAELTLTIAQPIELGKKRARRIAVATQEKALVQWDYESARADVVHGLAQSFVELLVAQERVAMAEDAYRLATDVLETIETRIQAGRVSPIEGNKARIAQATAAISWDLAKSERATQQATLAAWWGATDREKPLAIGQLFPIAPLAPREELTEKLTQNPDLARWATELMQREAMLALEKSQRKLDPTLLVGIRSTGTTGGSARTIGFNTQGSFGVGRSRSNLDGGRTTSLVLGFSIPLPLFNRNQGRIAEARALLGKAKAERHRAAQSAETAVSEAWYVANSMLTALTRMDSDVLPNARETFQKTQVGYRAGKFSYLDVLDAQRTLFDARERYLVKLATYHQARITLERLVGTLPTGIAKDTNAQNNQNLEEDLHE